MAWSIAGLSRCLPSPSAPNARTFNGPPPGSAARAGRARAMRRIAIPDEAERERRIIGENFLIAVSSPESQRWQELRRRIAHHPMANGLSAAVDRHAALPYRMPAAGDNAVRWVAHHQ